MTCRELSDFVADYFAGELAPAQRDPFELHLSRCPNCRRYLSQYRATIEAGRQAFADPATPVGDDVPEELVKAILAARKSDS